MFSYIIPSKNNKPDVIMFGRRLIFSVLAPFQFYRSDIPVLPDDI